MFLIPKEKRLKRLKVEVMGSALIHSSATGYTPVLHVN